jgi:hypothetical protein
MPSRSDEYRKLHHQGRHHFPLEAQIEIIGESPWEQPSSHGYRFNELVMSEKPTTVSAAIAIGEKHGFKPIDTRGHLLWATLGSRPYLRISHLREVA